MLHYLRHPLFEPMDPMALIGPLSPEDRCEHLSEPLRHRTKEKRNKAFIIEVQKH